MNKKMSLQNEELQSSTENQDSKQSLFDTFEVKDSPFTLLCKDGNVSILMGNMMFHENQFKSKEEAILYIAKKPYELIFFMCFVLVSKYNKDNNNE